MASQGKAPLFWDQPALKAASELPPGSNQIAPGQFSNGLIAFGIYTALPESPNDPWPDYLSPWDTIKMAGMRAPGIARVHGGRGRRFNPQVSAGSSGALPNSFGYDPGDFTVTLTLWTPAQWRWLYDFIQLISPPPSAKVQPKAVKVEYEGLKFLNLYDCYVIRVAIPEIKPDGSGTIVIPCSEYLLPQGEGAQPLQPNTEYKENGDKTMTVSSRTLPPDPSVTSSGP